MTAIKICGLTRASDAAFVAAAGADYIGLNFWPRSKRYLAPADAPAIAAAARGAGPSLLVGVFVNPTDDEVRSAVAAAGLDVIQLHGDEDPARVAALSALVARPAWKALAVRTADDVAALDPWPVDALLLDTPSPGRGGSGHTFDWGLARAAHTRHRVLLAGGLTPDNVAAAIAAVAPWGVDVASGVESAPGGKDSARVAAFITAARES